MSGSTLLNPKNPPFKYVESARWNRASGALDVWQTEEKDEKMTLLGTSKSSRTFCTKSLPSDSSKKWYFLRVVKKPKIE